MIHVLKVAGGSVVEVFTNRRKLTIFWDWECCRGEATSTGYYSSPTPTTLQTAEDALAAWEWLYGQ